MIEHRDRSPVGAHDALDDPRNENILVHVDGALVPRDQAAVSVYDAGFLMGDGVWEGLRLHHGTLAFLDEHLDRLFAGAAAIALDIGRTRGELTAALDDTVRANDMTDDVHVRLMVTRGRKQRPFQDPRLNVVGSTIVIIAEHSRPDPEAVERGIRLASVPFIGGTAQTLDPKLNTHSRLNYITALIHALDAGADEALLLDPFGFVNTTNGCNFFIVRAGEVWTSTGEYCLNGITRGKVIELCRTHGIPIHERNFTLADAYDADEAFLTGTFGAQTPVFEIDGHPVGDATAGPVFTELRRRYADLLEQECGPGSS